MRGPKGELKERMHGSVHVAIEAEEIKVTVKDPEEKRDRALWGLYASLIKNMVAGVTEGFQKKLEIYRASSSGKQLVLNVGFSHPVEFELPAGIDAAVAGNVITVAGIDKQLVGETAAQIRKIRKPEPYKGKGIKYSDEVIRRKAGKSASKGK